MAIAATTPNRLVVQSDRVEAWGWLEVFVLIQSLSTALLFLPEAQSYRFLIRALPYGASAGLALLHYNRNRGHVLLPPGGGYLAATLLLLGLNLLHPTTVFPAGIAQLIFQLCIAAPVVWVAAQVQSVERLNRLLWLLFLASSASSVVGLAQVFYPDTFMPNFSTLGLAINPQMVRALSYVGANGQLIIRPPGLTDVPGGAAIGGLTAALLGIVFGSQTGQVTIRRIFCFTLAGAGVSVIYFSQVRSLILMLIVAIIVLCVLLARQGHLIQSAWIGGVCATLLVVAFGWAVVVGGKSVLDKYSTLTDDGLVQSFQQNRGIFVRITLEDLVTEYPFGAGVGRWGMMSVYFGGDPSQPRPIWAEIQMTGWLLDGGLLMWFLYGGAILTSLYYLYRVSNSIVDVRLKYLASVVLCLNCFVVGQSFAGPIFNTQFGIQFWFLTAALYGVSRKIVPIHLTRPVPT
jgi:hypothetical protein